MHVRSYCSVVDAVEIITDDDDEQADWWYVGWTLHNTHSPVSSNDTWCKSEPHIALPSKTSSRKSQLPAVE